MLSGVNSILRFGLLGIESSLVFKLISFVLAAWLRSRVDLCCISCLIWLKLSSGLARSITLSKLNLAYHWFWTHEPTEKCHAPWCSLLGHLAFVSCSLHLIDEIRRYQCCYARMCCAHFYSGTLYFHSTAALSFVVAAFLAYWDDWVLNRAGSLWGTFCLIVQDDVLLLCCGGSVPKTPNNSYFQTEVQIWT